MDASPLIGIDLGTTHSLIAVFRDGEPHLIPNAHGEVLTPSVVSLLPSGEVVVGSAARELALTSPDRSVACFKRWMGTEHWTRIGRQKFSPQELSALVLRSLVADAAAYLGKPIESAVITVPAYFNQHQRNATIQAAEMIGLGVDRIVNEPTAAALIYGFHQRDADQKLVVFDLGGGTFDVTVMEIFDGALEILGTAGESRLGGEDFTDLAVAHALRATGRHLEHVEMTEPLLAARLRQEAETLKRALGEQERAVLRLPDSKGHVGEQSERIEVTQGEFAELVAPLLERLRRPTLRALRDAGVLPGAIDEVILVGGATRMPLVRSLVTELFDRVPRDQVHPDEAVGLGAAVQAALVADDRAVDDLVMTDVCPHSLGVEIVKEFGSKHTPGYFLPIIHRNTTVPVSREETVSTVVAGQTQIQVRVYQGESRKVAENLLIGEMLVDGLPKGPSGQEVILRFTYDSSGLLEVEAIVVATEQRVTAVMQDAKGQMSQQDIQKALARMQALKVYPRENLENQRLLQFAVASIGEVAPFQRGELEEALDRYEGWLNENDAERFHDAREQLLFTLSSLGVPYLHGEL